MEIIRDEQGNEWERHQVRWWTLIFFYPLIMTDLAPGAYSSEINIAIQVVSLFLIISLNWQYLNALRRVDWATGVFSRKSYEAKLSRGTVMIKRKKQQ